MYCYKCGKEIPDNSSFCQHCGAVIESSSRIRKPIALVASITIGLIALTVFGAFKGYEYWQEYRTLNPILTSADDISPELLHKIINNKINSLTINYEFTRCKYEEESSSDWFKEQLRTNPFWGANHISPIKRLEFEIKLGSTPQSLECAFVGFEKLEYVNIKDTSNVTNMSFMLAEARSFNQPIGNWNTSKVTNSTFPHDFEWKNIAQP